MAIHIDIIAHLRKRELIKEGEELKRYVESLEKDVNKRMEKGAQGRSKVLIKANDTVAESYDTLINATDSYVAATKRHAAAVNLVDSLSKKEVKDAKELEKHLELLAYAEQEVNSAMLERAFAAQRLKKANNAETRAVRDLNEQNKEYVSRQIKVGKLVGKNRKEFASLTRVTNKQRRELESLHSVNLTLTKDNAAFTRQMDRLSAATAKTRDERKKYNEMVKENTATAKQFREQSKRVVDAHEAERRVIRDTTTALDSLAIARDKDHFAAQKHNVVVDASRRAMAQHTVVVDANRASLRSYARDAVDASKQIQNLRTANTGLIDGNAAAKRSFDAVAVSTEKAFRTHKEYNAMARDGSVSQDVLRRKAETVSDAYAKQRKDVLNAADALDGLTQAQDQQNFVARQHQVVVDANRAAMRQYASEAVAGKKSIESLRAANQGVIRDNAGLSRSFDAIAISTKKATDLHADYNRMARDGSVDQDTLRKMAERVGEAYAKQARDVDNASESLRRHQRQQMIAAANRTTGAGGGGGGGDNRHVRFDPGRWAARNLGALTPLGMVTPTLVLPLGTAFTQIANAAVAASQSIALLPAALTAGAAAFGTIQMATAGFGDTIKALMEGDLEKFAEQIQGLSPAAQQAALTIQNLAPQLKGVQQAAQEAFFANTPQLGFALFQNLGPMIEEMTTGIATEMNRAMMDVGALLLSPRGMSDIKEITAGITTMFQALEPAVTAVAHAFLDLTTVGSHMLPIMAHDLAEVANTFSEFINGARDSGALREFMYTGWQAIKEVGAALLNFGKMLYDVFGLKSQEDVAAFRDTMQEMTDVIEVLLRTLKTFFEDIAAAFRVASDFVKLFGGDLETTSTILARIAEAWLFIHLIKWAESAAGAIKALNIALAGTAVAGAAGGGGAAAGGALGLIGRFGGVVGALTSPIGLAITAVGLFGAAAVEMVHKLSMTDFQEQTTPNLPGTNTPRPGTIPGTGGIPFPSMTDAERARIKVMTGGKDPHEIPIEQLYKMLGRPVPPPAVQNGAGGGAGTGIPGLPTGPGPWGSNWPGPFAVPGVPTKPGDFQSTPGTYEMANIPVGQFGGAQWQVPPGVTDLPPDYQNLGKTGFYQPDQFKIFQAQGDVENARASAEEKRIALLAAQADNTKTQDDINKAANDVIQSERAWLESMRKLKEEERGDFVDLTSQTNSFASDLKESLGDLGAALDPDFGISKGLAGIAENLVKFVATLGAAPVLGAMKGAQAGLGFPGGKGVGSGLIGMIAAQHGYYQSPYSSEDQAQWQLGQQYGIVNPTLNGPVPANVANRPGGGVPSNVRSNATGSVAQQIIGLASSSSGGRYASASDLAGGLSDCSGAVSDLVEIIKKGRADAGRLPGFVAGPNTREALTNLGAVEGAIPGALQVGWVSGGPGGGHMRSTLPNGVAFESGGGTGQGATYGGSAQGAATMPNVMSFLIPQGSNPVASPAYTPASPPATAVPPVSAARDPLAPIATTADPRLTPGFARGGEVPIIAHSGEHVLTTRDVSAMGGQQGVYDFRRSLHFDNGGGVPLKVPWGVDPRGGSKGGPSASPFAPWWDMDWLPPEHPGRVGGTMPLHPGETGQGKWWYRGPTVAPGSPGSGRWPPVGKHRKPLPGYQPPPDPSIKHFDDGGSVGGGRDPLDWIHDQMGGRSSGFNPGMQIDTGTTGVQHPAENTILPLEPRNRRPKGFIDYTDYLGWVQDVAHQRRSFRPNEHLPTDPPGYPKLPRYDQGGQVTKTRNPLDVFAPTKTVTGRGLTPEQPSIGRPTGTRTAIPGVNPSPPIKLPAPPPSGPPPQLPTPPSQAPSSLPPAPGPGGPGPTLPSAPPPPGVPHGPPIAGAPPTTLPGPAGVPTQGSQVGSEVAPYEGYGEGFKIQGGIVGALTQGAAQSAGGMLPGGAAAAAALQIGIEEIQRGIEFGAQAAGIGVQGVLDTVLPTGGSALAQENWLTRIVGGIAGAAPNLPNLAGGKNQGELGQGQNLPGVGPSTPEQIAAQAMDPLRAQHTGTGPAPGPSQQGVFINTINSQGPAEPLAQDIFRRYAAAGQGQR